MSTDTEGGTFATIGDAEGVPPNPKDIRRRWLTELELSANGEKEWRKEAHDIWELYRGAKVEKNSYNVLWANTEITRPSLYNSLPNPDVRRRFRDADPLGKAMSETMKRSLEYTIDVYNYDKIFQLCVLDMCLPGRGVMRLRYKPTIEGEVLSWECVMPEHVQWDDFRRGAGKTWAEVSWIAFRHRMTRSELVERFGEDVGNAVTLDDVSGDNEALGRMDENDVVKRSFKTAEVWEIWDKDKRQVLFVSQAYDAGPCQTLADPLGIDEFWPMPEPIYAIEDSETLTPTPIYHLYKEQAEELNRISSRINRITQAIKFRGIYDSTIAEMSELMRAPDNEFIPASQVSSMIERGGLEKGIWVWPVNTIAQVLDYLYKAREGTKAVIYELTGISDIVRGATQASETLGAQQLKAQYAGMRIGKMQANVQRFIRDAVRIAAGIIAEKFQQQTLQTMTQLPLPTDAELQQQLQQQQMQYQQAAMQAQQTGEAPPEPPQPPQEITWEQVLAALKDNPTRSYKIDIETDSTIQQTINTDMESLGQLGQAINMIVGGMTPLVEQGYMPIEAVKEMIGAVTRRARLGNAVEDALEMIQNPPPKDDGQAEAQAAMQQVQQKEMQVQQKEMGLQQREMQVEQAETQTQAQMDAAKLQSEQSIAQLNAQTELQKIQMEIASRERIELAKIQNQQALEQMKLETERMKMEAEANSETDQVRHEIQLAMKDAQASSKADADGQQQQQSDATQQVLVALLERINAPKKVVRDNSGRISGVEVVGGDNQ